MNDDRVWNIPRASVEEILSTPWDYALEGKPEDVAAIRGDCTDAGFLPQRCWEQHTTYAGLEELSQPGSLLQRAANGMERLQEHSLPFGFIETPDKRPLRCLEIGGGYGDRVVTYLQTFGKDRVSCVMVDAVPPVILFAELFLKRNLPGVAIGAHHRGDRYGRDKYGCYITPSWRLEEAVGNETFDLCMNSHSFQEMAQQHVDFYMGYIDKHTHPGSIFYSVNPRGDMDGVRNEMCLPSGWERVYCSSLQMSVPYTAYVEVFKKD